MTAEPPLTGLKVLELARVLAGPFAGQTLADLGADVIKVEAPAGDDTRRWGPPWIDHDGERAAAYYHACNRGKRSITANFRTGEGRDLVRRLAARSDVVIENFKHGGLAKYGLDYAALSAINPRLVYCSITGFGHTGPYADLAGYDFIVQGMSGLMDLTGDPDGTPQKVGIAIADLLTGLYGVIAIQAALAQRERTGKGQHIDLALMDCMTGVMTNQAMNYLVTGKAPHRMGTTHPNIVPYQAFPVSDGYLIIAVGNDAQYRRLVELLQMEAGRAERFATNAGRVEHRAELVSLIAGEARNWKRADLLEACKAHTIPAGPINTLADVFSDPQVIERELKILADGVPGIRTPITFTNGRLELGLPAPRLDQHRSEILTELQES
ncbi:CaiB/BaiF CoA-transferase family protein [Hyphobacterium sp. HN65]|uniref:CaiB/BaiF CoA-transferase family protein n=1 Tax=Hyphobacterium lacteum TaxID=3116575 RepID=A0ABU7LP70_9PROT|nr:CaiB/BaiF CoA-transferase family protein [Hyphobacterium sp. HN65]MEE2525682.1 CaiB/BaiF CoA-transferase family protein [Hyphobacterium sp. HN65]